MRWVPSRIYTSIRHSTGWNFGFANLPRSWEARIFTNHAQIITHSSTIHKKSLSLNSIAHPYCIIKNHIICIITRSALHSASNSEWIWVPEPLSWSARALFIFGIWIVPDILNSATNLNSKCWIWIVSWIVTRDFEFAIWIFEFSLLSRVRFPCTGIRAEVIKIWI